MTLHRSTAESQNGAFESFEPARHSDIHALRRASPAEIRARYLRLQAEHLLEAAEPLFGPGKYEIVFDFVTNHILMPPDREGRDAAVEILYQKMKGVTLLGFSANLAESVELVRLAKDLDGGLVAILEARRYSSVSEIDPEEIKTAIVEEDREADRRREVTLLCNQIRFFHKLVNTPLSRFVVPSMKSLARAIGVAALVDQIDVGYAAGRAIDDVDAVCEDILRRSNAHLDELFGRA